MKRRRKTGRINYSKVSYDGTLFASKLEVYCYKRLKEEGLFEKYEEEKFTIIEGARCEIECTERQSNGKGELKERGLGKKILGITYTPDFTGSDYIIETKGRANDTFPIRWKLFKLHQMKTGDTRSLYKPQNQKEIDIVIELIKKKRHG